ncbi:hypothetical protein PS15p_201225 [Mucor circinelloides]
MNGAPSFLPAFLLVALMFVTGASDAMFVHILVVLVSTLCYSRKNMCSLSAMLADSSGPTCFLVCCYYSLCS